MLDIIHHLTSQVSAISGLLTSLGAAGIVEVALRLIPSAKPLSIMYVICDICHGLGNLALAVGDGLDKILPNRTK